MTLFLPWISLWTVYRVRLWSSWTSPLHDVIRNVNRKFTWVSCEEMLVLQEALCPVKWYLSCSLLPAIVINNFLPVPTAAQQGMIPQCDEEQWWRLWFKCLAVKLRYSGGLKKAKLRGAPCILTSGATIGGLALWMSTQIEWFLYKVVDSGGCHNSLSFLITLIEDQDLLDASNQIHLHRRVEHYVNVKRTLPPWRPSTPQDFWFLHSLNFLMVLMKVPSIQACNVKGVARRGVSPTTVQVHRSSSVESFRQTPSSIRLTTNVPLYTIVRPLREFWKPPHQHPHPCSRLCML